MRKEIKGIVRQNPQVLESCCLFLVRQGEDVYLVISTDRQASKDHIFVDQGEEIRIQGNCIEDSGLKGVIVTERAEISISGKE